MPPREDSWQNKILFWVFTTAIILNISFSGWLVKEVLERPTQDDVKELISGKAEVTNTILQTMKECDNRLKKVIQDNTDAINALPIFDYN